MLKAVLVFPRFKYPCGNPPLGTMYVASYARENTDAIVSILDTTFSPSFDYVESFIKAKRPDIVGITVLTLMYDDALKVAEIAKRYGGFIIMGGPHATLMPETFINNDNVDAVCIGEGELTFSDLIRKLPIGRLNEVAGIWFKKNGNVIKNPLRAMIDNLDRIPFPARDLIDMERYMKKWFIMDSISPNLMGVDIIASRGCPYDCTYCQPTLRTLFGRKIRKRSPENIVNELLHLKNEYRINAFIFQDDTLLAFPDWVGEICEHMKEAGVDDLIWGCNTRADITSREGLETMRQAGLGKIFFGGESGSQRVLDEIYGKRITVEQIRNTAKIAKSIGIKNQVYFMLGAPGETREEIEKTITFSCSLDADEATFSIATPLPYTHLYNIAKKKGWKISNNFAEFDYYKNQICRTGENDLSQRELDYLKRKAFLKFYLHPKRREVLKKNFLTIQGIKKSFLKLKRLQ